MKLWSMAFMRPPILGSLCCFALRGQAGNYCIESENCCPRLLIDRRNDFIERSAALRGALPLNFRQQPANEGGAKSVHAARSVWVATSGQSETSMPHSLAASMTDWRHHRGISPFRFQDMTVDGFAPTLAAIGRIPPKRSKTVGSMGGLSLCILRT